MITNLYEDYLTLHHKVLFHNMTNDVNETLNGIRQLMEESRKVMFLDGSAGILISIWAAAGVMAASYLIGGSVLPAFFVEPCTAADWESGISLPALGAVAILTFTAAFATIWLMTSRRAARLGYAPTLNGPVGNLLKHFFAVMMAGGLVCLTTIVNGTVILVPGLMLVFYGIALMAISPIAFRYSITKYLGYAQVAVGIVALCLPEYGLSFWFIGFCLLHLFWGLWFRFSFDRK